MYSVSKLQAYIRVLDMNEHRPVFLKPLYEVRAERDPVHFHLNTELRVAELTDELLQQPRGLSLQIITDTSEMQTGVKSSAESRLF